MCKPCDTGADVLSRAKEYNENPYNEYSPKLFKRMIRVGRELHTLCKGDTHCTCQHKEQAWLAELTKKNS